MPITPQDIAGLSPQEIAARFSPDEIRQALAVAQPQTKTDGGFGNRGDFFDITPVNPDEDFLSADNLGRLAGNIPGSALNVGKDVFNAVTSPVETANALIEAGPSGILGALGDRFGNLKKTAVEDPFGLALDVAPVGSAVGAAAKAGKLGGTAGRIAQTASRLNPATAVAAGAVRAGKKAGELTGMAARELASVASGIDSGVFSTARQALAPNQRQLREVFSRGGKVADDVAAEQASNFAKTSREEFAQARKGGDVDAIPEAAQRIEQAINTELNQIAEQGKAAFQGVPVDADAYLRFLDDLQGDLATKGVEITPRGVDLSRSAIPRDVGARRNIGDALDFAFEPLMSGNPTIGDVWMARRRIDEAVGNALAAKAGFGGAEENILKGIKSKLNDFLATVDSPEFKQFNREYSEGAALRERFAREVTGTGAAGKNAESQISAVVRSIKEGRSSSEAFLTRVEARTGTPLRAIAAGKELSQLVPRGLIGRGLFASAAFGSGVLPPSAVFALLGTSPKFLGKAMQGLGLAERQLQAATGLVQSVMSLPGASALAEQGLTLGAIMQQLEREQPNLLGAIGATNRR